ncbi:hypothetical protein SNE40_020026 [Patella caerulea]|uniref:DUF4795 domain-containing protein n=1 Tax=Patella caerulea TaxID=87958 RepID=A0AAN8GJS2_PATCE
MAAITLSKLLDLAIGTPEVGAVNFNLLYRLLNAMLKKLELVDHEMHIHDLDKDFTSSKVLALTTDITQPTSSPYHELERKVLWITKQMEQLCALPTTMELSKQVRAQGDGEKPLSEMWQYIKLKKRVEANEDGINKLLAIAADLMKKIDELHASNLSVLEKISTVNLKNLFDKINEIELAVSMLNDRYNQINQPDYLSQFVTWNILEDSLKGLPYNKSFDLRQNLFGYGSQLLRMNPEERHNFIEEAITSDTLHQYLPRVDDGFVKLKPDERKKVIEDSIEKGTFQDLLVKHGSDLLKMNPKERGNFIEETSLSGILRNYLPGLDNNFETKDLADRIKIIEDSLQIGKLHKYFPSKFQSLREMTTPQRKCSIDSVIRNGYVEDYLPGVGIIFEKMDHAERERFIEKAAKSGLVETYERLSEKQLPLIAEDIQTIIEKIIIKECQTLMYDDNGTVETPLATNVDLKKSDIETTSPSLQSEAKVSTAASITPPEQIPGSYTSSASRPGTSASRPCSRVSTPGTLLSSMSIGPSADLLDILDRLGTLYDQHNKLIRFVKSIDELLKEKAEMDDLNKLNERVTILEELLNQKLEKSDLDNLVEQVTGLQKEIGTIQECVNDTATKEPQMTKVSLPNIDKLVESKATFSVDSLVEERLAFVELMERVCGLENKISLFQESLKGRDSANSIERPAVLAQFDQAKEGTVTRDIMDMLANTAQYGSDELGRERLIRLGWILDDQLTMVRDKISGLDEDLKLMARGVELAIQRVKGVDSTSKLKQSTSNATGAAILDGETLQRAQNAILELQGEIDRLQATTQNIIRTNTLRQHQIEDIMQTSKELYEGKADKEFVLGEFDVKADKRLLESKVNHSLFNKATDEINKMIKEVEGKLEGNESSMNNLLHQLTEDVDGKLDRLEMDPLKGWMESRLKELNQKIAKSQPGWSDDDAAGLRKQLIQRFHCLSCDKSINIMPKNPIPSLPSQTSMANTRSPRPYTIFELNQIRQHASKGIINQNIMNFERALLERQLARIRKSDLRAFIVHYSNELESLGLRKSVVSAGNQEVSDYYARTRACGGLHTMTFPHRRTIRITGLNRMVSEEDLKQNNITETYQQCGEEADVLGADGIIYKGRCMHSEKKRAPKGMKATSKDTYPSNIPPSTSQPLPASPSRPVSAKNRSQIRPGSARPGSRPLSARPNTVHALREGEPVNVITITTQERKAVERGTGRITQLDP